MACLAGLRFPPVPAHAGDREGPFDRPDRYAVPQTIDKHGQPLHAPSTRGPGRARPQIGASRTKPAANRRLLGDPDRSSRR